MASHSYVRITAKLREDIIDLLVEINVNAFCCDGLFPENWEKEQIKKIKTLVSRLKKAKFTKRNIKSNKNKRRNI